MHAGLCLKHKCLAPVWSICVPSINESIVGDHLHKKWPAALQNSEDQNYKSPVILMITRNIISINVISHKKHSWDLPITQSTKEAEVRRFLWLMAVFCIVWWYSWTLVCTSPVMYVTCNACLDTCCWQTVLVSVTCAVKYRFCLSNRSVLIEACQWFAAQRLLMWLSGQLNHSF